MRAILAVLIALAAGAAPPAWPQWGGPSRNFVVDAPPLATTWPADGPKRLWERTLGDGYSAIVSDARFSPSANSARMRDDTSSRSTRFRRGAGVATTGGALVPSTKACSTAVSIGFIPSVNDRRVVIRSPSHHFEIRQVSRRHRAADRLGRHRVGQ